MEDVREIKIQDYDYTLPEGRIALHPLAERDTCRLLVDNGGAISHRVFSDLPLLLSPDTLMVANETKVIRARLEFRKHSGAKIEIFLLEPVKPHDYAENFASVGFSSWACLIGNKKKWKEDPLSRILKIGEREVSLTAELGAGHSEEVNSSVVAFRWDAPGVSFAEIVEAAGVIPIPPYLKRESEHTDATDYQTVFSRTQGSVAAPTAGLHFTPRLIEELKEKGVEFSTVTLHVGAGTFQPVKSEEIGGHPMHSEWFSVSRHTLHRIMEALATGRDVLAVGTTSVRTLESLPYFGKMVMEGKHPVEVTQWMPYGEGADEINTMESLRALSDYMDSNKLDTFEATTSIMIAPGFRWRIVNRLITNFHQPKSTLLLLVSSFLGRDGRGAEKWKEVYAEALASDYRFLSYGDACLFTRGRQPAVLPASKSMVLRAALISAVRNPENPDAVRRFPVPCDDVRFFLDSLYKCLVSRDETDFLPCYIGEGAAPLRFLLAFAASLPGAKITVTCAPPLRKRPVSPLVDSLRGMGADINFNDDFDNWEIKVRGKLLQADRVRVDTSFTSQFLSALLMVSPLWEGISPALEEAVENAAVSRPYIKMTLEMMKRDVLDAEPDWSAAAFFYESAFIRGRDVELRRLVAPVRSLQGDAMVCDLFTALGVNTAFHHDGGATLRFDPQKLLLDEECGEFRFDFTDFPDMVPALAVALCYRKIPFRFSGVAHLQYKETNRLSALLDLLSRLGYGVGIENQSLVFNGEFKPLEIFPIEIDPRGDHRMAMAFYPLEMLGMVRILDKEVVAKSFPDFYIQMKSQK